MAGKLVYTLEDYQKAAIKYRPQLLRTPIIGIRETLKYMTERPGIRYSERVGKMKGKAQFAPYKASRRSDMNLNLDFRELRTYFGSVVAEFEPNSAISTLLGVGATKGDGQASTPSARDVLLLIADSLSETLNDAVWNGVRNANGDTTQDLFDGFDTITGAEKTAGNIAESKGNYLLIDEEITSANAEEIAKEILYSLDPKLRKQTCYLYCPQSFLDAYNQGYQLAHGALPYNQKYEHTSVEGSEGKLIFAPLSNKAGSSWLHVSPKSNMLVGYDQMGDVENVMVKEYAPFILSYIATMFFGVQFESIDKEMFKAVEIPPKKAVTPPAGGGSGTTEGGGTGTTEGGRHF